MPPSPWIHSITMPAVRSLTAASSAATSLAGTKRTPGSSGSKSSRYLACPVIDSAPRVRPWKELSSETISYFSRIDLVAVRAHHLERAFHGFRPASCRRTNAAGR